MPKKAYSQYLVGVFKYSVTNIEDTNEARNAHAGLAAMKVTGIIHTRPATCRTCVFINSPKGFNRAEDSNFVAKFVNGALL